jgi:hypothetical protein
MESVKVDSVHLSQSFVKILCSYLLTSVGNRSAVRLANVPAPRGCTTKVACKLLSLHRGASAVIANLTDKLYLI